jgi:nucleoside-diphosphate-sugar epimerase
MGDVGGRRVLVTGAGGFIGANLVRTLLAAGATPIGVVRPGSDPWRLGEIENDLELASADLADPDAVAEVVRDARPELAVHLGHPAGHPRTAAERLEHAAIGALGTAALVESLAEVGCGRLVHVGSSLEYGPKARPVHEDDVLAPVVPRGGAKAAASLVCLAWARTLGLSACVVRPFSVYGPWEHDSRLVPSALRAALEGSCLPLTGPDVVRDFVYVGDVGDAIVKALTADGVSGVIVNVGSGAQTSIEELVATVGRVVGRVVSTAPGSYPRHSHDTSHHVADIVRARRLLGWEPSVSIEEGLRQTLTWLEERSALVP